MSQENKGDTLQFDRPDGGSRQAAAPKRTSRKGAKKKRQQLFTRTLLYALFVIFTSLLLTIFILKVANDALALTKPSSELTVQIERGSAVGEISNELKEAGLIEYRWAFILFTKLTGNADSFQYGTYLLNTDMDYLELATNLQRTATFRQTVRVMIPEGRELHEIIKTLDEKNVCSAEELWEAVETMEFDYDFLEGLPERENRLEGYLFPDTYEFFEDSDAKTVLAKFLDNFKVKFDDEMKARAEELGMTIDEVVTLASIIEREAA
ncbi:MAG: endolytic transglycosylase MltG, partial [Clostridia bacterium]|nr:endolytic transglycosylase MltG [Clostridia bacterium]